MHPDDYTEIELCVGETDDGRWACWMVDSAGEIAYGDTKFEAMINYIREWEED